MKDEKLNQNPAKFVWNIEENYKQLKEKYDQLNERHRDVCRELGRLKEPWKSKSSLPKSPTCAVCFCFYGGKCWYTTAKVEAIDGRFSAKTLDGDDISDDVLMWMDFPKLKFEERF